MSHRITANPPRTLVNSTKKGTTTGQQPRKQARGDPIPGARGPVLLCGAFDPGPPRSSQSTGRQNLEDSSFPRRQQEDSSSCRGHNPRRTPPPTDVEPLPGVRSSSPPTEQGRIFIPSGGQS